MRAVKWYFALTKRLFKHASFILILLFIPLCAFGINIASQEDYGVLTIAISCEEIQDETYNSFKEKLIGEDSVINFYALDNYEDAVADVNSGKADCAWVFRNNLSKRMNEYTGGAKDEPVCRVYVKEDSIFTKISREKLYGLLLCNLSVNYCYDFISQRAEVDRDVLSDMYVEKRSGFKQDFVEFTYINSESSSMKNINYVTSPIRGLLAIAVTVSILAAMMLSLNDENEGRFSYFPVNRRLMLHYSSCFASGVVAAVIAAISMFFANINVSLVREIILMILFVFSTAAFSCLLGTIFSSISSFSYVIPISVLLTCVFCPVFINTVKFPVIRNILPAFHYLSGVYSNDGIINMLKYCAVVFPLSIIIYHFKNSFILRRR